MTVDIEAIRKHFINARQWRRRGVEQPMSTWGYDNGLTLLDEVERLRPVMADLELLVREATNYMPLTHDRWWNRWKRAEETLSDE